MQKTLVEDIMPTEQIQQSLGGLPKLVPQIQHAYSHFWPMFVLTHQPLVPFVNPETTPCPFNHQPFRLYSASGPYSFSATLPYPYYTCDAMTPQCSPHPGPSAPGCMFSPLISPISDTFVYEYHKSNIKNKGKFTCYFPSPSRSLPATSTLATPPSSVVQIPTNTPILRQTLCTPHLYTSPHTPFIHPTPLHTPFQLDPHILPIPPILPPMIPPPFSQLNLDVPLLIPTHLMYPRSFKVDLPDLSKIPLLSSDADWSLWFRGISDMINNLCFFHHICPEPAPGFLPDHLSALSYPPPILPSSSSKDITYHNTWWHADGTIWHILQGRLGPGLDPLVPPWCDTQGMLCATSWDLYAILLKNFGSGDHSSVLLIKQCIRTTMCGLGKDAVTNYITA